MESPLASPALIGLDWGTSSLRAYLMDASGRVVDDRTEPWGIMQLGARSFSEATQQITREWAGAGEVAIIASGMVGSAQGWMQAPYCPVPAGPSEIASALVRVPHANVHIVPGVAQHGNADVMRGEETQIIGALSGHPSLHDGSRVVCPGTHSKWVTITEGRIVGFATYMTGELYSVLMTHSILGRAGRGAADSAAIANAAFVRGVRYARYANRDSASLIFSARARVLLGEISADDVAEYLSGVLIGSEVRDGLAHGAAPAALIGDRSLCARYAAALGEFDVDDVVVIDGSAARGLWQIALAAALVTTSAGVSSHTSGAR